MPNRHGIVQMHSAKTESGAELSFEVVPWESEIGIWCESENQIGHQNVLVHGEMRCTFCFEIFFSHSFLKAKVTIHKIKTNEDEDVANLESVMVTDQPDQELPGDLSRW